MDTGGTGAVGDEGNNMNNVRLWDEDCVLKLHKTEVCWCRYTKQDCKPRKVTGWNMMETFPLRYVGVIIKSRWDGINPPKQENPYSHHLSFAARLRQFPFLLQLVEMLFGLAHQWTEDYNKAIITFIALALCVQDKASSDWEIRNAFW